MDSNLDPMYLVQALDRCPPFLLRIMAIIPARGVRKARRLPQAEIIRRSGLSRRVVTRLSYVKSWKGIKLETASRFAAACGVDLTKKNQLYEFFRSHSSGQCDYLTKAQRQALERLRQESD